ncbi:MAG TPA: trypsin-like peptidase domain-containing protein [Symbiobacteriaceae bacterium]|nr:trypsin-like peptidase domain-containing protein [Symbiobacteriaceae bacterium]
MDPWSTALIAALDKVRPGVAHIEARTPKSNEIAVGTGVILDHYHMITSAQIVAMEDQVTVKTVDGKRRPATCIGIDPLYFLAILRLEERLPFDPPALAPEGTAPVGLHVFTVGYALGQEHTVATGVISSSDRTVYRPSPSGKGGNYPVDGLIITSAQIHPGNTGGPLCDLEGRIVGINGLHWQGGLSLALQASVAGRLASQIIDYGKAVHPWLGFSGEEDVIDQIWVGMFGLPVDRGVLVQYVAETGPAKWAGLKERDIVLSVDGRQPISTVGAIRKILSLRKHGEKATLKVLRQGDLMELDLVVSEMPNLEELPRVGQDEDVEYGEDE